MMMMIPIAVTVVGMVTDVSPDCLKTPSLTEVTLVGMMIDFSAVHPSKAFAPKCSVSVSNY